MSVGKPHSQSDQHSLQSFLRCLLSLETEVFQIHLWQMPAFSGLDEIALRPAKPFLGVTR